MPGPLRLVPTARRKRPLLVFISDIHLTDELGAPSIPWETTFGRFWQRIEGARGDQPAELCIVGDFIDIVRSVHWLKGPHRPYHEPEGKMLDAIDEIVASIIQREQAFFDALRTQVQAERLRIHYVLGNHDRLLKHAQKARTRLWEAMTGEHDPEVVFPDQKIFRKHGVLAYHGHTGDFICSSRDGSAPLSDIFGLELIVRFPGALRERLGRDLPHLDDIDDVRPIYAVPSWIRQIGHWERGLMRPASETWGDLVEEFLENDSFDDWIRRQKKVGGVNPGAQIKRMLALSTGKVLAKASDKRLTRMFKTMQHLFDGKFAERAAGKLQKDKYGGLRYVVNGHSHFPSMTPLGHVDAGEAVYFNSGTWRTVHQIGTHTSGRPTFLPYDAMSYIVFFGDDDPLGREFEWWTGAMVGRNAHS